MVRKFMACLFIIVLACTLSGCKKELPATEYVQANLNLTFQGETQEARQFIQATDRELEQVYENGIIAFVESYLTGGLDSDGSYTDLYAYVVKEIFRSMRYQVGEAVEVEPEIYEVVVEYQPTDVFQRYIAAVKILSADLERKLETDYYMGSEEEQQEEMYLDYLQGCYELLGESYVNMKYGPSEVFTFTVVRGDDDMPKFSGEEMNQFIERILALDKI